MSVRSISVIGLGHVGLATAACLATAGFEVHGFDVDRKKVEQISKGRVPFHEPKLEAVLKKALNLSLVVEDKLDESNLYMITVGTPTRKDGSIDLGYVRKASKMLGVHLRKLEGFRVVAIKSTVSPGTTENVVKPTIESASGKRVPHEVGLVANPEFLREGSAVDDTRNPDRVVIGEFDERSGDAVEEMYRTFYGRKRMLYLRTSAVNAELIKYASNAFLAMKIGFANSIADMAARLPGADVNIIVKGIGVDKRIGPDFLRAGLGYGGSCLPKDVKALISTVRQLGTDASLFEAVETINLNRVHEVIRLATKHLGSLSGKRVTLLGLSFKPNTDDVRDAVSLRLIDRLLRAKSKVVVYDPLATGNVRRIYGGRIDYSSSAYQAIEGSDCCFLVTEWDEFRKLGPVDFARMRRKVVIDGRRMLDSSKFKTMSSFEAVGLGPR